MSKTSRASTSQNFVIDGFEGHYEDLGGNTVGFETHTADADLADLFKGLPDDLCQCRHWGVVVTGQVTFRYPEGDEVITAGEAYYARPGHTPVLSAGTELVEFSPTDELARTIEVVVGNLAAAGVGDFGL